MAPLPWASAVPLGLLSLLTPGVRGQCPVFVIDVRSESEYDAGAASCASRIPIQDDPSRYIPEVLTLAGSRSARVLVYCRSGARAASAVAFLEDDGWTDVTNVGGWESPASNAEVTEAYCACSPEPEPEANDDEAEESGATAAPPRPFLASMAWLLACVAGRWLT